MLCSFDFTFNQAGAKMHLSSLFVVNQLKRETRGLVAGKPANCPVDHGSLKEPSPLSS
jgi:hypothetical protein